VSSEAEHRALVARLFPHLAVQSFEPVGGGRNCYAYEVDHEWIVQLPRSGAAEEMLLKQIAVLPELALEVSGAVPIPEIVLRDPLAMGYRKIAGAPLSEVRDDDLWPERLGRFLYDLHMVPPEFVGMRARGTAVVREDLGRQLGEFSDRVFPLLSGSERAASADRFRTFMDDEGNWRFAPCVTHGDIASAHILVTAAGDFAGVIDWEQVSVGDPAADFAWLLHAEPTAGERALAAYGGAPDEGFRDRVRFRYMLMPWYEVIYGLDAGEQGSVDEGLGRIRTGR
jgi:aminoglycoside phosphotransferase (APT) family kinase protein